MSIYASLYLFNHNPLYLTRYINFIKSRTQSSTEYTESHHILPKCIFPEFKNFSKNPWNKIKLTAREHFIAHRLLAKAYPTINSLTYAIYAMCRQKSKIQNRVYRITSRNYEFYKKEFSKRRSAELKGKKLKHETIVKFKEKRSQPEARILNSYRQLPTETLKKYSTLDLLINDVLSKYNECWGISSIIASQLSISPATVNAVLIYKGLDYIVDQVQTKVFKNYSDKFKSYEDYEEQILNLAKNNYSVFQTSVELGINECGVSKVYKKHHIHIEKKKSGPKNQYPRLSK